MTDKLVYSPSTIIPQDQEGLIKYLQEELDKLAFIISNLQPEPSESTDDETEVIVEAIHNDLLDRDAPDAHPIDAITGLSAEQARQDLDIAERTKVFFQSTQPTDTESTQGDLWFKEGWD